MKNIPYELIARYLAGECNDNEKQQLMEWSQQHPDLMDEFTKLWQQIPSDEFSPHVENALQKVNQRIDSDNRRPSKRLFLTISSVAAIAAIIILLIINVTGVDNREILKTTSTNTFLSFNTDEKEVLEYVLSDGSKVWLNGSSTLKYPEEFANDIREIHLEGEAFFDIAPDASRPFIIYANNTTTRVVGTSFGIKAVKNSNEVVVTVATGIINFSTEGKTEHIELKQGEQGICDTEKYELEKNINPDPNSLAWKTKILIFKQSSLKEVAAVIEKVYHIPVSVNDSIADLQLTSIFEQLSLEEIMQIIELTLQIKAETNENGILLTTN